MLGSAFLHEKACFAQCCPTHFFTPGATCNPFTVCDICIRAAPVAACILQPCSMRRTSVCKNPSVSLSVTVDVWHFVYRICVDLFHQMPEIFHDISMIFRVRRTKKRPWVADRHVWIWIGRNPQACGEKNLLHLRHLRHLTFQGWICQNAKSRVQIAMIAMDCRCRFQSTNEQMYQLNVSMNLIVNVVSAFLGWIDPPMFVWLFWSTAEPVPALPFQWQRSMHPYVFSWMPLRQHGARINDRVTLGV